MSVEFLFNDAFLAAKLGQMKKEHRSIRRQLRRNKRATVALLDDDLGQVALLLRGVTELCIERGIFSAEELAAKLSDVDIADGIGDGRLDADVVMPGESKLAKLQPIPVARRKKKRGRKR